MKFLIEFCCDILLKSIKNEISIIIMNNKKCRVSVKDKILLILEKENVSADVRRKVAEIFLEDTVLSDKTDVKINEIFSDHCSVFDYLSSEHKRFNFLRERGFIEPRDYYMGVKPTDELQENIATMGLETMQGVYVPLKETLKKFLEVPGVLSDILDYMQKLANDLRVIYNVTQGSVWLSKYSNILDQFIIPLLIYYDELEVGNALGTHAGKNKFGATYACIGCLPPKIASKIDSIFFYSLLKAQNKKKSSNQETFDQLVRELNFLQETGIVINDRGM